MNLAGQVKLSITLTGTKSFDVDVTHNAQDPLVINDQKKITSGVGALMGNVLWHDRRTLSAGANDDLDLAGVLEDAFGDVVTLARVKFIYVKNRSTTDRLKIGAAASNPLATLFGATNDYIIVRPGGRFLLDSWDATGYVITAGSADTLRISHLSDTTASLDYDIVLAGGAT